MELVIGLIWSYYDFMKTIQKSSEQLLLAFYVRHTTKGYITREAINFELESRWTMHTSDSKLRAIINEICGDSPLLAKNTFKYLKDKKLINFEFNGVFGEAVDIYQIEITEKGVDIIEGVEGASNAKNNYQLTFNVDLGPKITVESLIKNELGSIFKLL